MRNFDYLKELDNLVDLYNYCNAAEVTQVKDPDKSALNSRRALEWLVRAIYEMKGIEVDKKNISVDAIKTVGEYKAAVKLHREVKAEVSLSVAAEE